MTIGTGSADRPAASSGPRVPPLVRDNNAVIDLRQRPSREALGFQPGATCAFYDRQLGSPGIHVKVLLPGEKEINVAPYGISSDSDGYKTDPTTGPPQATILNVRYASLAGTRRALNAQADALGLDPNRIVPVDAPGDAAVVGGGSVDGLLSPQLAISIQVQSYAGSKTELSVNYNFYYDVHNVMFSRSPSAAPRSSSR